MKRSFLLITVLFSTLIVFGQDDYNEIQINKTKKDTVIEKFRGLNLYNLEKYQLLVGIDNTSEKPEFRLLVFENDSIIFKSKNSFGYCYSYNLYFFKKGSDYIILGEAADESIWGYDIYLLDKEVRFIENIKYTGIQKFGEINGPRSSLIPFVEKIRRNESNIIIELKDKEVYQLLKNCKDKVVKGKEQKIILNL